MMEDENEPYKGLKLDMLDLVEVDDKKIMGVLTDFQVGQLVRQHVHGLKADAWKFKFAWDEKIKRSRGCRICFYTGFQVSFSGFGSMLDPARECGYCTPKQPTSEKRPEKFWYYMITEYPDEGAVFPFRTEAEARAHARYSGMNEVEFAEREATEEEQIMINYGRQIAPASAEIERLREALEARGHTDECYSGEAKECDCPLAVLDPEKAR